MRNCPFITAAFPRCPLLVSRAGRPIVMALVCFASVIRDCLWCKIFHPNARLQLCRLGGVWWKEAEMCWKQAWLVWSVPAYLTGIHFVFHVDARYSMPARPFLFIYASLFLVFIWDVCRKLTSSFWECA
jgi:hypothetical protein